MDIFLQPIINGVVLGSIYALVALGYTMVYGILGLINFAHGEVVMVGALVSYSVMTALLPSGMPPVLLALISVLVAAPVCMALAWAIERYAYRPLRHAPKLTPLISAIGVSILLQNLAMMIWGRGYHAFPDILPTINYDIAGAHLSLLQAVTVALAGITMAILAWMIQRTSLGQAMRATAENPAIAELMGIPVNRIITITFVIGGALLHGLHARPQSLYGSGAGRYRQHHRCHAGRLAARLDRIPGCGLHRRPERRVSRLQLPGYLCLPGTHCRACLPSGRTDGRARFRTRLSAA